MKGHSAATDASDTWTVIQGRNVLSKGIFDRFTQKVDIVTG